MTPNMMPATKEMAMVKMLSTKMKNKSIIVIEIMNENFTAIQI